MLDDATPGESSHPRAFGAAMQIIVIAVGSQFFVAVAIALSAIVPLVGS